MDISIKETAQLMGKSERQVRYMIRNGELKAVKKGKSWSIDRESLPFSERQVIALNQKRAVFTDTIDKVVDKLHAKRMYTFTDLKSFQLAYALYRECEKNGDNTGVSGIRPVFIALAAGYHSFEAKEKTSQYEAARQHLCELAVELFMAHHKNPSQHLAKAREVIESEIIPSVSGLIRGIEKRDRWRKALP